MSIVASLHCQAIMNVDVMAYVEFNLISFVATLGRHP